MGSPLFNSGTFALYWHLIYCVINNGEEKFYFIKMFTTMQTLIRLFLCSLLFIGFIEMAPNINQPPIMETVMGRNGNATIFSRTVWRAIVKHQCEARVTTGANAIHQSINQSIDQTEDSKSVNQSINPWLLLIFIEVLIKQSINQLISLVTFSVYPINQSTNFHFEISFLPELCGSLGSDPFLHRFWW